MIAAKIEQSSNYKMFELLAFNRDVKKISGLMASMKKYGWINSYPMNVTSNGNGKMKIKDGHHRFESAQRLGIPVKYTICNDKSTVQELDKTTHKWTMQDCLVSYCREGKIEYVKVKAFCEETGIGLSNAVSVLGGNSAGTANFNPLFREGNFKIKTNCPHANIVKELVLCCKKSGVKFYNTNLLVQAFSKIAWVDKFDIPRMKSKIKLFSAFMEKKANLDQYLTMLEEIYNRQSRDKIPLKFLAEAEAKRRNVALFELK